MFAVTAVYFDVLNRRQEWLGVSFTARLLDDTLTYLNTSLDRRLTMIDGDR